MDYKVIVFTSNSYNPNKSGWYLVTDFDKKEFEIAFYSTAAKKWSPVFKNRQLVINNGGTSPVQDVCPKTYWARHPADAVGILLTISPEEVIPYNKFPVIQVGTKFYGFDGPSLVPVIKTHWKQLADAMKSEFPETDFNQLLAQLSQAQFYQHCCVLLKYPVSQVALAASLPSFDADSNHKFAWVFTNGKLTKHDVKAEEEAKKKKLQEDAKKMEAEIAKTLKAKVAAPEPYTAAAVKAFNKIAQETTAKPPGFKQPKTHAIDPWGNAPATIPSTFFTTYTLNNSWAIIDTTT